MKARHTAGIYLRKRKFLVHSMSRTTQGLWILSEPFSALPDASEDRAVGTAIRKALDSSLFSVLTGSPLAQAGIARLLKLARAASWTTFAADAERMTITADGDSIAIQPCVRVGADDKARFDPRPGFTVILRKPTLEQLGAAARRLLVEARQAAA